jgi:hypothetical protein
MHGKVSLEHKTYILAVLKIADSVTSSPRTASLDVNDAMDSDMTVCRTFLARKSRWQS